MEKEINNKEKYTQLRDCLVKVKNKKAYLDYINNMSVRLLTEEQAELIGKTLAWKMEFRQCLIYAHANLPRSEKGITYLYKYFKAYGLELNEITPEFFVMMAEEYKNIPYDDFIIMIKKLEKKKITRN